MVKHVLSLAVVLMLVGCASARSPVSGFWYTNTYAPEAVSSNQAGNKVGEACASSILGIIATGDSSVETARRNGGVTMITSVDSKANSILGIYAKFCTIVRGR